MAAPIRVGLAAVTRAEGKGGVGGRADVGGDPGVDDEDRRALLCALDGLSEDRRVAMAALERIAALGGRGEGEGPRIATTAIEKIAERYGA